MIASRPAGTGSSTSAKRAPPRSAQKIVKVKEDKLAEPEKTVKNSPEKATKSLEKKTKSPELKKPIQQPSIKSGGLPSTIKSESSADVTLPWVDKYKPTSIKQIIGTCSHTIIH